MPFGTMDDQLIQNDQQVPEGVQVLNQISLTNYRNGTISSQNYPNNYDNNALEWYTIDVTPADKYILFRFEDLDTYSKDYELQPNCGDNATIYYYWNTTMHNSSFDDENLETFCTNKNKAIYVNGIEDTGRFTQNLFFKNVSLADSDQDHLRVLFVSDSKGSNKGFKLSWAIYHDPPAPEQEVEVVQIDPGDRVFSDTNSLGGSNQGSVENNQGEIGAQQGGNNAGSVQVIGVTLLV